MKYELKAYQIWEFGQRKDKEGNPHQEDSMYPLMGEISDKDRMFIVCDGMGGHDAGEVASATVCEAMSESINHTLESNGGKFDDGVLQKGIDDAFDALDKKDTGAEKKMGTTMTFLKLHANGFTAAHMGDSRIYQIRPGATPDETKIVFKTRDHSLVNDLIAIGEMTEEEARHSNKKNVITRAMQPNMERRPKATVHNSSDVKAGDYFYLCTDGMLENMEDDQLKFFFVNQEWDDLEKVEKLVRATENNRDNHTAIVVHITNVTGVPERPPLQAEVEDIPSTQMGGAPPVPPTPAQSATVATTPMQNRRMPNNSGYNRNNNGPGKKSFFNSKQGVIIMVALLVVLLITAGLLLFLQNRGDDKDSEPKAPSMEKPADKLRNK